MKAGRLTERVAFGTPTATLDALGGDAVSYAWGDPVAAQWIYGKGDESVQAAREAGRYGFKVKVRSSAAARAITTDHRMRDARDLTVWNITEVDARSDEAKRARMVFLVAEGPVVE